MEDTPSRSPRDDNLSGPVDGLPSAEQLVPLVYDELHRLAKRFLSRERHGHTLQATALVNEAWLRVGEHSDIDKEHFLALGAQAMRRVLVDHARRRGRLKRGGEWQRVTLAEPVTPGGSRDVDLVEINDVLDRLAKRDERSAKVVELRFFGGLNIAETARVLGISRSSVDNDWYAARAWLARELRDKDEA